MELFKILIVLILFYTIALQSCQFWDFSEDRSLYIDFLYIAIIVLLLVTTDFLQFI
jgi:hypothetical protein